MRYSVGMRELHARAGGILRRVHERNETVDVTYHGQVIARIVPVAYPEEAAQTQGAVWTDIDTLAQELRQRKLNHKSAATEVSEGRQGH